MKLISPSGVRIRTSDELGKVLLKQGYKEAGAVKKETAPAPAPAPKRRSRAKSATNDQ